MSNLENASTAQSIDILYIKENGDSADVRRLAGEIVDQKETIDNLRQRINGLSQRIKSLEKNL